MRNAALLALSAGAALLAAPLQAQTVYFGENTAPAGTVSGAPATAQASFLGQLSGVSVENFDGFALGSSPPTLTFTGSAGLITANLAGGGTISAGGAGRFPTSGAQLYETNSNFSAAFSTSIAAFGFYATDIGDFSGQLSITLIRGMTEQTFLVPHTVGAPNSSLLFFGIIDTANPFDGVRFSTTTGDDFFGFDDMIVGDVRQVTGGVPEPGTWAMMLLGFGAMGFSIRRRRRTTTPQLA